MRYVVFEDTPDDPNEKKGWVEKILTTILPSANPDFRDGEMNKYAEVARWWLELNDDGSAAREIGFDISGNPIVAAPIGKNYGIFTDSFAPSEFAGETNATEFEAVWMSFAQKFELLTGNKA